METSIIKITVVDIMMAKEMGEMTAEQKDKKQSQPNQISHGRVVLFAELIICYN